MKLTPWFPGSRKPVRPGVYIRDIDGLPMFSRWNGLSWFEASGRVNGAAVVSRASLHQRLRWRGLAEKPKGAA